MLFPRRYLSLFIIFLFLVLPSVASAQSEVSSSVISYARKELAQGKLIQAMTEYCRALLINPDNVQSLYALENILQEETGLSAQQRIKLLQIVSLFHENNDLRQKVNYYQEKIDNLQDKVSKILVTPPDGPSESRTDLSINPTESLIEAEIPEALAEALVAEKETLLKQYRQHRGLFDQLQLNDHRRAQEMAFLHAINQSPAAMDATLHSRLSQMQSLIDEKEAQIQKFSQQLVNLALELSEKQMQLTQHTENLMRATDQAQDMESRFRLGQKIIEEKNGQILSLQSDLASAQKSLEQYRQYFAQARPQDHNLKQLNGILEIYRGRLKDSYQDNKLKEVSIELLEERLTYVREIIDKKQEQLELTFENVKKFEAELKTIQSQVVSTGNIKNLNTVTSENDLTALNQWVEQTQEFLTRQSDEFSSLQEYLSGSQ